MSLEITGGQSEGHKLAYWSNLQAQRVAEADTFEVIPMTYNSYEILEELELLWVLLDSGLKLLAEHTDMEALEGLLPGTQLRVFQTNQPTPEVCFGRIERPVGLVTTSTYDTIIYESPGSNLRSSLKRNI